MFLASGLSVGGRGDRRGKSWEGTGRNPGLIPGNMESAGDRATGEGTWVPRLERRANASCLADSPGPPPPCSCYLCVPPSPKGSISKLQTPPLSGSVPLLHFQVPPGLLGPALQNPVPQNPALGQGGGQRRSPRTTHQRRGSARGWATQAASSAASRRQFQPSQSSRRPQAGAQPRRQGSV